MNEFYNILTVVAIILTLAFIVKVWRTKVVSRAAELAATPFLVLGVGIKYLAYFGAVAGGIIGVFSLGMVFFIYLGGEVVLPGSISFGDEIKTDISVNWAEAPSNVERWRDHIAEAANKCGVDEALLTAMVIQESGGDSSVCSKVGACGLLQLMPATAKEMGVVDVFDPLDNLVGGACYMRKQLDRYDGDVPLALAAYNAGAGNVDRYGGIPPFKETQLYVRNVTILTDKLTGPRTLEVFATALPYKVNNECCRWPTDIGSISQYARAGHVALDIAIPVGTPLYASHSGVVTVSGVHNGKWGGYGEYIIIEGPDYKTLYGHLSIRGVTVGEEVKAGQRIGYSGNTGNSTGPHLHYEIYHRGKISDPLLFLPAKPKF